MNSNHDYTHGGGLTLLSLYEFGQLLVIRVRELGMGASASGLSGSQLKEQGKRDITEEMKCLNPGEDKREERTKTALRDYAADRVRFVYPNREKEGVIRLAEKISDSNRLQEAYFSSVIEDYAEGLPVAIIWRDIASAQTKKELTDAFDNFALQFEYGPYCATVKIGNLYLQWDNTELVIPQAQISSMFTKSLVDSSPGAVETASAAEEPLSLEDVDISAVFREDFVVDMRQNATEKIKALMDVLVCYNTKYRFGLLTCNCQHFVSDVVAALEAKALVPRFEDCLSHHNRVLEVRGANVLKEEFNSHEELDTYVNIRLENMDIGELYFCYGHYLLFHAWSMECPQLLAFKCPIVSCRCRELQWRV